MVCLAPLDPYLHAVDQKQRPPTNIRSALYDRRRPRAVKEHVVLVVVRLAAAGDVADVEEEKEDQQE